MSSSRESSLLGHDRGALAHEGLIATLCASAWNNFLEALQLEKLARRSRRRHHPLLNSVVSMSLSVCQRNRRGALRGFPNLSNVSLLHLVG